MSRLIRMRVLQMLFSLLFRTIQLSRFLLFENFLAKAIGIGKKS